MKKIVWIAVLLTIFLSCKKQDVKTPAHQQEQKPDFIDLPNHPKSNYPITLSGENVIFLDMDGQGVYGTSWNVNGQPINAAPTTLTPLLKTQVIDIVKEHYSTLDVIVATDSTVYWNANPYRRIRCIITPTCSWYNCAVGGVAFLHSFIWGSNEVCWVFDTTLPENAQTMASRIVHEVGHTLGLYHQGIWDGSCNLVNQYNPGSAISGYPSWAPTMGVPYDKSIWTFTVGHDSEIPQGCTTLTDEYAVLNTTYNNTGTQLANRPDVVGDIPESDDITLLNGVALTGSLEYPTDVDVYLIPSGHWSARVTVTTFGTTDVAVNVYDSGGTLKETVDPPGSADIPQTSVGGVIKGYMPKYIAVRNTTNNPNIPAGSLRGTYQIMVTY